jgi:hypothetical protein
MYQQVTKHKIGKFFGIFAYSFAGMSNAKPLDFWAK